MKRFGAGFLVLLLVGCSHTPERKMDGQSDGGQSGLVLRLNQSIEIPPDSASVRLQFGHTVARNAVQEEEPHCIFELSTVNPEIQRVTPEKLQIVSVQRREQTFSGMPVWPHRAYSGAMFRDQDRPSHIYFITVFRLKSSTQPQIRELTCQHNQATSAGGFMRHLTLSEIRAALGTLFSLEANPHWDAVR